MTATALWITPPRCGAAILRCATGTRALTGSIGTGATVFETDATADSGFEVIARRGGADKCDFLCNTLGNGCGRYTGGATGNDFFSGRPAIFVCITAGFACAAGRLKGRGMRVAAGAFLFDNFINVRRVAVAASDVTCLKAQIPILCEVLWLPRNPNRV